MTAIILKDTAEFRRLPSGRAMVTVPIKVKPTKKALSKQLTKLWLKAGRMTPRAWSRRLPIKLR